MSGGTSLAVQWLGLHLPVRGGVDSIPSGGAKIPHALRQKSKHKQKIKQKQHCKNLIKTLKMVHIKRKKIYIYLGTSLTVQWLRLHFLCRGHRFDPQSMN